MEENAPNLQLQEPVSPESLLPARDFTPVFLGVAGLVVIAVLILILRSLGGPKLDPTAARKAAYRAAKKALDGVAHEDVRETAVATSLIIRRFLADSVGDPSLFETHEEFLSRHDSLKCLNEPAREACSAWFSRIARLKYAPETPADEPAAIVADAKTLLETLNGGFLP